MTRVGGWLCAFGVWGVAAALVVLPLTGRVVLASRPMPPIFAVYTDLALSWGELVLAAAVVAWVVGLLVARRRPARIPGVIAGPILAILALAWLGVPGSVDPAFAALQAASLSVVVLAGWLLAGELARTTTPLLVAALVIAFGHGAVAIAQAVAQGPVGLGSLGELTLDPARAGTSVIVTADGTRWLRAYGLTGHPNILGGVLAAAVLVIVGTLLAAPRWRWLLTAAIAVGTLGLVVTLSRAAALGLVVGSVVAVVVAARARERSGIRRVALALVGTAIVGLPLLPMLAPAVVSRTAGVGTIETEVRSLDERAALAAATVAIVLERPILGAGIGGLPIAMRAAEPDLPVGYAPAHLVPLAMAAELGVAGGIAAIVVFVAPWWLGWRDRRSRPWSAALAGSTGLIAAITVIGLLDHYPWTFTVGQLWVAVGLGWFVAARSAIPDR